MKKRPYAIMCDIDGTLALLNGRDPYNTKEATSDIINDPIANILSVYDNQKLYSIALILISGRDEKYRNVTEQWLSENGIDHYKHLYLRKNGDYRKDFIIKQEIYKNHIEPSYDVLFVLEDRDQVVRMWRDIGLTCLQVAEGTF